MVDMFDKWDKEFDWDGLNKDLKEYEKNGNNNRTYREVKPGTYEVSINKMELTASKEKRLPMMTVWFKIVAGEFKNSIIFYNQVVSNTTGMHFACELLRQMELDCVSDAECAGHEIFKNSRQFAELLLDANEEIDKNGLTFGLKYGMGKNDFHTYEITDVFEN